MPRSPLLAAAALLLAVCPAAARGVSEEAGAVGVGVWLVDVHTVDFLDGSFGADFYMWWTGSDEAFRPFEVFQVVNGRDWKVRSVNRQVLPDGSHYASALVSATINHDWDLHQYPFDRHRLRIVLETPYTASQLRLVPDREASLVSEFASVEGFRITSFRLDEHVERYATDFGLRSAAGDTFSRLVVEVGLERESQRIIVTMFVGFLVANLMALLTYAVHVTMLSIRSSMCAGAIFGAVGNMYFLHRAVNPALGSLIVDRLALVTFGGIVVALLTGIIVDRIVRLDRIRLARIVNWSIFTLVLLGTLGSLSLALREVTAP